jgi:hypothetical protein
MPNATLPMSTPATAGPITRLASLFTSRSARAEET